MKFNFREKILNLMLDLNKIENCMSNMILDHGDLRTPSGFFLTPQKHNENWLRVVELNTYVKVSNNAIDWFDECLLYDYLPRSVKPFTTENGKSWAFCMIDYSYPGQLIPHNKSMLPPLGLDLGRMLKVWEIKPNGTSLKYNKIAYFVDWLYVDSFIILELT